MVEEDVFFQFLIGFFCDEIDLVELFESGFDIGVEGDYVNDRGFGLEFDLECEDQVDLFLLENDFFDDFLSLEFESFLYGVILLRDIR